MSLPWFLMNPNARRLLVFCLLALAIAPVLLLIPCYPRADKVLDQYHLAGLGIAGLSAYVLANLCAPSFMAGSMSRQEYVSSGPRTIITLT